jgi:hypothetical protein
LPGPCVAARSITRLAPAGRAPSTVASRAESKSGVLCVVWARHACRVGTNKSKQVGNKPGGSWDLAVLAVVERRRPYNSTCSRRRIQSNVALLNPASQHTTKRRRKTRQHRPRSADRTPRGAPAELVARHVPRRDTSSIRDLEQSLAKDAHCTSTLHRLDAQASQTVRPDGSRGRG